MTRRPFLAVTLVQLLLVAACASDAPRDFGTLSQAIEGGVVDTDARWAVALCEGDEARGCELRCSGVLLAPNLVLTARHCITSRDDASLHCATSREGPVRLLAERTWVTAATDVAGAAFVRGKRWSLPASVAACGHDLALLTLEGRVEHEATTTAPSFAMRPATRETVTLVAYGEAPGRADGPAKGLRKRKAGVPVACSGGGGAGGAASCGETSDVAQTEFVADASVCPGDSGGGAVWGEPPSVLGVLSRTLGTRTGCGLAVFSTLDAHALLLARVARQAADDGAYPVAQWVLEAEARGNADGARPRSYGSPCDGDADCDSKLCRSPDGGRRYVCARACDAACPDGSSCRATGAEPPRACFVSEPPQPDGGGCSLSGDGRAHGGRGLSPSLLLALALAAFGVISRAKRRRGR